MTFEEFVRNEFGNDADDEAMYYHIDALRATWNRQQAKIEEQAQEIEKYKQGYDRYETARLMNVRMWSDAYELNIKTGKPFDQIIDELKPFLRPGK